MTENYQVDRRQRSGRVHIRVPVEVRGHAADGSPLQVNAQTGVVSANGGLVLMACALPMGAEVELTNFFSERTAKFRVVWINDHKEGELWEIGIESLEPLNDFWGVTFPVSRSDAH